MRCRPWKENDSSAADERLAPARLKARRAVSDSCRPSPADLPEAVSVVGPVHGVLFLWTMAVLAITLYRRLLPIPHGAVVAIAAFIPFGGLFSHHLVKRRLAEGN
ncbi:DUF3817 domain-containing protein [Guyparkeria halophila]|uniref:DUF3817 domain-containing protein n=1 Tax=Guyparkeria halophila TaxID=47960 RepID=A0A6I6D190_9GAMM|nr:DUF3817 domain-containing protein [Guyparkeria halophila]QGT77494.1 DUF3817 domain-containing protein [Guyparkeria halophila]